MHASGDATHRGPPPEGELSLSIDKRKALFGAGLAVLLAGAAFTVIGQVAHFGKLAHAVAGAKGPWLAVGVSGQLLAYLGYILAYHDIARASGGPRFSFKATARIVIFGAGASVFAASVGGLAVDYWALRRTGTRRTIATRRVLAVGTVEWVVLSLYACVAAALMLLTGRRAPLAMAVGWLTVVPACAAGAWWLTSPRRVRRFVDLEDQRVGPAPAAGLRRAGWWALGKLGMALDNAVSGVVLVRHLLAHPFRYRGGAVGYPIYWAGDMLTLYAAVRAFGGAVSPIALILAYATGYVITSLPLPAGGAGGVEAAVALALHAVGVSLASALLGVFLYRVITFWLPVLPALALIPSMRRLNASLRHVPHTRPDADERISFRPRAERRSFHAQVEGK